MSEHNNNNKPHAFAAPANTPIVGQPFSFAQAMVPVSGQLTCHCRIPAGEPMPVDKSAPVTCPHCQNTYIAVLPLPPGAQVVILKVTAEAAADQVPS